HTGGDPHRLGVRAELTGELRAHAGAAAGVGDHETGGGAHHQRRNLRHQSVTDREDGVGAGGFVEWHAALHHTYEDATHDVDRGDEQAGDRVALHELGGAVHRAEEVRLARDLLASLACLCLVYQPGAQVRVNRH